MLIKAQDSALLIVDVQERLAPVMADPRSVIYGCARMVTIANRLGVPVLVSEQYPAGLGPSVPDLRVLLPDEAFVTKNHFSGAAEPALLDRIKSLGRRQIVIAGIEAHVCVLQTALGLKAEGFDVYVAEDICSSRVQSNARNAYVRMRQAGVATVVSESVAFEWLGCAGTPEFKDVMTWIK